MSDPSNEPIEGPAQTEPEEAKTLLIMCYQCGGEMTPKPAIIEKPNGVLVTAFYYECTHCDS